MLVRPGRALSCSPITHVEADALAAQLLGTMRTRLGGLHIDHARRVAATSVDPDDDPRVPIVALLHDVVEKMAITPTELREIVQDDWICDAVDVLTTTRDEPEQEYLARCAANPVTLRIKRRDLADKLESDDIRVGPALVSELQEEARRKLEVLEQLARDVHPPQGGARPPGRGASSSSATRGRRTVNATAKKSAESTTPEPVRTPGRATPLTPEQLGEIIALLKGADSAELKLSVPDTDRRSVVAALDMDPLAAQMRQVVFFDTPELTLNQAGVVLRARRVQGREADSVVKLRPVVPAELPPALRRSPWFGVEVDAMPGGFVCSATLKSKAPDVDIKAVFDGKRPIRKAFTKEQRAFYAEHAPAGLEMDHLFRLGPITVLKLKLNPADFGRRLVAELWFYPDGSRLLELSTKCTPQEAFGVSAEAKAFLAGHGVDLLAEQQTKTRTALDFYASELAASR